MAGARQNLFKWNRQTNPKTYSGRSEVQDWIKRVQRESTQAAREVFGNNYQSVLEQVHVDDDALVEAQDLLDSWLHEKKHQDDQFNLEVQFKHEKWAQQGKPLEQVTRNSVTDDDYSDYRDMPDQFLQSHDWSTLNSYHSNQVPNAMGAEYDEDLNDEISVQHILRDMLDKNVVEKEILNDLGFDGSKKKKDPRPKMELRHKQVKEKSQARQKDIEKKRRENAARKQAEAEARQHLLREEREQQAKLKREEDQIQKEMTKIRRAMEEEKKATKEKLDNERRKEKEAELLARQYLEEEQRKKEEQLRRDAEDKEEMRRMLLEQMEKRAAKEASNSLRILQRHFSAWYSVVASQRIKLGKAKAMSDWRCKLRAWNAWLAYVNHIRSDKEAQTITMEMKEKHRKEQLSLKFHRRHLLLRCLRSWQQWVKREQERRQLQEEHEKKTQKMAALLQAAATGRLWSERGGNTNMGLELQDIEDDKDVQSSSTARKLDEIFSQPARTVNQKHSLTNVIDPEEISLRRTKVSDKPPIIKPAWSEQQRKEQSKREFQTGREARSKSNRQRSYSEVENIETLYSTTKNREKAKSEDKKTNPGFSKSKSDERLDSQEAESREHVLTGRSASSASLDNGTSSVPSKYTSREAVVKSQKPTTKPLHLAMEERAQKRQERKKALDEKKRKAEEERLEFLKKEQERKEAELLAEKQEALQKRREEKRIARERELEKQRQLEQNRQQISLATQHYACVLLKKYGLSPWRHLVETTRENMSRAVLHHNRLLLTRCFHPWLDFTRRANEDRLEASEALHQNILLRRMWRQWRKFGQHAVRLQLVAEDYCSSYLVKKYFRLWQDYVTEQQILLWEKERAAEEHNEWRLKKLAMIYWKKYIPMLRSEREKEVRRADLRKRVHSWLPDFQSLTETSP